MLDPAAAAPRYMPPLDSLRAIAVIGVMVHHFYIRRLLRIFPLFYGMLAVA
jgi:peptidoglycan/LPS O-acetylase OafA/YrhL